MVTDAAARLRGHLVEKYETLLTGLSARLGSRDQARDALQDAYVKLSSSGPQDEVRHPTAYLFRMALNIAANARRRDPRALRFDEVGALRVDHVHLDAVLIGVIVGEVAAAVDALPRAAEGG